MLFDKNKYNAPNFPEFQQQNLSYYHKSNTPPTAHEAQMAIDLIENLRGGDEVSEQLFDSMTSTWEKGKIGYLKLKLSAFPNPKKANNFLNVFLDIITNEQIAAIRNAMISCQNPNYV